jgi:hypothetical protein
MVSWDYPRGRGLKDMIEQGGLFPVTTLTSLNSYQKQILLDQGIVLCKQISSNPEIISKMEMNPAKRKKVLDEVSNLFLSAETIV